MENDLLAKPAQKEQEEKFEKLVQDSEGRQQSMHAAQPRPCLPVEEAGEDEMGVLGKDQVVAGGGAALRSNAPRFGTTPAIIPLGGWRQTVEV